MFIGGRILAIVERHFELVVLIFAIGVLIIHFASRRRLDTMFIVVLAILALLILLLFGALAYSQEPTPFVRVASVLIVYGAALFVILSELLPRGFAKFLTSKRGEKWTKEMDYFYLTLGILEIIGSLGKIQFLTGASRKQTSLPPYY